LRREKKYPTEHHSFEHSSASKSSKSSTINKKSTKVDQLFSEFSNSVNLEQSFSPFESPYSKMNFSNLKSDNPANQLYSESSKYIYSEPSLFFESPPHATNDDTSNLKSINREPSKIDLIFPASRINFPNLKSDSPAPSKVDKLYSESSKSIYSEPSLLFESPPYATNNKSMNRVPSKIDLIFSEFHRYSRSIDRSGSDNNYDYYN
jgi:hypothetical protein